MRFPRIVLSQVVVGLEFLRVLAGGFSPTLTVQPPSKHLIADLFRTYIPVFPPNFGSARRGRRAPRISRALARPVKAK